MDKIKFEVKVSTKEAMKFGIGFAIGTTIGKFIARLPITAYNVAQKRKEAERARECCCKKTEENN